MSKVRGVGDRIKSAAHVLAVATLLCLIATRRGGQVLAAQGAPPPRPSVRALTAAAAAYVAEYQRQMAFLLADESSLQRVFDARGHQTDARATTGEMFVAFLPADRAWISVHDTATVDGRAVADRQDVAHLLERQPVSGVARQLAAQNARFNIGHVMRNFNEPTLALLVLESARQRQFKFGVERVHDDASVALLTFKETDGPTLVHGADGRDVFSRGAVTIEIDTGRVHDTSIQFSYGSTTAELTTTYKNDSALGLWVPVRFGETYEARNRREVIRCDSTYSNYRRFGVTSRVR